MTPIANMLLVLFDLDQTISIFSNKHPSLLNLLGCPYSSLDSTTQSPRTFASSAMEISGITFLLHIPLISSLPLVLNNFQCLSSCVHGSNQTLYLQSEFGISGKLHQIACRILP